MNNDPMTADAFRDMLMEIDEFAEGLTKWENDFLESGFGLLELDSFIDHGPSEAQETKLRQIWEERVPEEHRGEYT